MGRLRVADRPRERRRSCSSTRRRDVESESVTARFTWHTNATDPVTYTCILDGSDPLPCTSPFNVPRLAVGEHEMEIEAHYPPEYGLEGELLDPIFEPAPTVYAWNVVDHTAPETAILYGPAPTTTSTSAYFAFASNDSTAHIECSLDFEGFGGCESPFELTDLLDGEHILQVRAVDEHQNADQSPEIHRWTIVRNMPNTPMGNNVTVQLDMPDTARNATANFFQISTAGYTGLEPLSGGPHIDLPGYGGARYFDIHTTAAYGEPVTLCLPYDPADFAGGPRTHPPLGRRRVGGHHPHQQPDHRHGLRRAERLLDLRPRARLLHGSRSRTSPRRRRSSATAARRRSTSPRTCPA